MTIIRHHLSSRWIATYALACLAAVLSCGGASVYGAEAIVAMPSQRHEGLRNEITAALDRPAASDAITTEADKADSVKADAVKPDAGGAIQKTSAEQPVAPAATEHPLAPVLRYALEIHGNIAEKVHDYRCRLVKRERVQGTLQTYQMMDVKLRHPAQDADGRAVPMAVYLKFLAPQKIVDREVVWVQGHNYGNLFATNGGAGALKTFTLILPPDSPKANEGTNYPISEIGILNLAERLIRDGLLHVRLDTRRECQVRTVDGAKVNGRLCKFIEVKFPEPRPGIKFHLAQIFIDQEQKLPVRYAAYGWPTTAGGEPKLLEEFTYVDIKPNVGLTDRDFDEKNPAYKFYVPDGK
ncbi:MAG: DUF1571 domain-containing protein [Planctomycetia bacterium]|nr:DUF1571 domain-containing protein [Planctomycetia bacterium]